MPILQTDHEPDADTLALVRDPRALHFWDARRRLPPLFKDVLGLPGNIPAWDVYLLYPRGVSWQEAPTPPAFWQHQLGDRVPAPTLETRAMCARVQAMAQIGSGRQPEALDV